MTREKPVAADYATQFGQSIELGFLTGNEVYEISYSTKYIEIKIFNMLIIVHIIWFYII